MNSHGPVTIGDLCGDGKALEIGCMNCDRHGYFDPLNLALGPALTAGVFFIVHGQH